MEIIKRSTSLNVTFLFERQKKMAAEVECMGDEGQGVKYGWVAVLFVFVICIPHEQGSSASP